MTRQNELELLKMQACLLLVLRFGIRRVCRDGKLTVLPDNATKPQEVLSATQDLLLLSLMGSNGTRWRQLGHFTPPEIAGIAMQVFQYRVID